MSTRMRMDRRGACIWITALCLFLLLPFGRPVLRAEDAPPPPPKQIPKGLAMPEGAMTGPEIPESIKKLIEGAGSPGEAIVLPPGELGASPEMIEKLGGTELLPELIGDEAEIGEKTNEVGASGLEERFALEELKVSEIESYFRGRMPSEVSKTIHQYGYRTFRKTVSTFAPITDVPVGPEYMIGPGDQLAITLWGRVEGTYRVNVDRNGEITLPKAGVVKVWGLRFADLKDFLRQEFDKYFSDFDLNVTLSKLRTIRVYVVGEAVNPGSYSLSSLSTAFNALFAAGGPSRTGSMRSIQLIRNQEVIRTIDLYDFLLKGDKSADEKLLSQDTIFIPPIGSVVGMAGQIKRPAIYEMTDSSTLEELIELSGGLVPMGYLQRVQIERVVPHEERIALDFDLSETARNREKLEFSLQDRDLVKISPIYPEIINVVYLRGHVLRPGDYALKERMRVTDLFPSGFDDFPPEPYLEFARIVRYEEPDYRLKVIPFHLGKALEGDADHNLELAFWDTIEIYPKAHFENQKIAQVLGEVRHPGTFDYHHEMQISDLIALSGGPTDNTHMSRAEISRVTDYWEPDFGRAIITFDLEKALACEPGHDLPVAPLDIVKVYSKWDLQDKPHVKIEGEVRKPGSFALEKGMRVSDLVRKAGDLTRTALLEEAQLFRRLDDFELVAIPFHLGKAMEGDEAENLVLSDLDRVEIHNILELRPREEVSISGMVRKTGKYELAVDMRVHDLVLAAGNLVKNAYNRSAELTRFHITQDGVETTYMELDLEKALAGDPEHNIPLMDYDHLVIRRIPELDLNLTADILGEVRFPGTYPVRKNERLSALIRRAGGYTDDAYLRGAIFTRKEVKEKQREVLEKMKMELEQEILADTARAADTSLSSEELDSLGKSIQARRMLLEQMKRVDATGRLVIRLTELDKLAESPWDITLETGDVLYVPPMPDYVSVLGSVYNPTSMLYEKGHTVNYYLSQVGGPTKDADEDQIYVVRANGTVVSREQEGYSGIFWDRGAHEWVMGSFYGLVLDPGDTIIVPEETEATDYLEFAGKITRMLFEMATAAGVVIAASK